MIPLAFNFSLSNSLRSGTKQTLSVLPVTFMFSAFVPLSFFASWLSAQLGITMHEPVRDHPNGLLWITSFLSVMVLMMIGGYVIGWIANAAISRWVLDWPMSKVIAVYLRSEVPREWLK